MLVTIVRTSGRLIATGVWVIIISSGPKPDPGIRGAAVILFIAKYADSCFTAVSCCWTRDIIEAFHVTVALQRGGWTDQSFPLVSSQKRTAVSPVGNHRVKRISSQVNEYEIQLIIGLHSEADLGERRVPVCCQLDFIRVECLSGKRGPVTSFVAPVGRIVMKRFLRIREIRKLNGTEMFRESSQDTSFYTFKTGREAK